MTALRYELLHRDTSSRARLGRVTTVHGAFDTPAFMPVGTLAAVKGLQPRDLIDTGSQIILANTYHLLLRPGPDLVAAMGGLQKWTTWNRPMLTDSGGFQVFSLADLNRITDDGVTFKSHIDGRMIELSPERSMQVQNALGADVIMAFDDCPPVEGGGLGSRVAGRAEEGEDSDSGATRDPRPATQRPPRFRLACERTIRWLGRCVAAHARPDAQSLFGIVQGGTDLALRSWCVDAVCSHDLPGYAIGGVAVGEPPEVIRQVVEHTAPLLPADRPRYLMGVGYERDIVAAVRAGVDMFDCVLPTRNGRSACAFTRTGPIKLRNAKYKEDPRPLEEGCDCVACSGETGLGSRGGGRDGASSSTWPQHDPRPQTRDPLPFSRSYLRHLFLVGEMLGPILVSLHNVRHFQRLMLDIRAAIAHNDWSGLARDWPVAGLTIPAE